MSKSPLKIVQLTASNVKRLKAVRITPTGDVVVLGGENGQGKSSVLDAISMALGGAAQTCPVPVRSGESKAEIVCDLGEYVVKRTFTAEGGSALTVTSKEGAKFPSPQAMLDSMTGRLTFDPLAFSRMKPAEQEATLKQVVGLDFSALDAERAQVFQKRTFVNSDGKAMRARLDAMPSYPDAPPKELDIGAILAEQTDAIGKNEAARRAADSANDSNRERRASAKLLRRESERASVESLRWHNFVREAEAELERWTKLLKERQASAKAALDAATQAEEVAVQAEKDVAHLVDAVPVGCVDVSVFPRRLEEAQGINAKVRANAARAQAEIELSAKRAEAETLTKRLVAIDEQKAAEVAASKMPVPGLGFGPLGVTLDGLPFEQASAAQQLRVSLAMGFAMNPRIRILLIRDGSLLDHKSMALVREMTEAAGAQLWIERVETDAETTIVIEDGEAHPVVGGAS